MTNKEAVVAVIGVTGNDNTIEKALMDAGITSDDVYSSSNVKQIDMAAISVLETMLATKSVSEGGYSVEYDIKNRLDYLKARNNVPTITALNIW